ncbi:hypothetical protein SPSPH_027290 [Sporomusa sphaeroides DSM 2875]|uniref:Uncharacterized protein n=1 Tax=Sporomusa sphaeroides DSM 2875 TaxID=1337886 RepID=A0ABM9W2I4_9FIRM|nr:hypothetical protein SPSPH_30240 [Sporomusa sphaeroides DSM 2875]CVK19379.1 hypothetical protein SSPH_02030 [Sporomusa sphaeroides DSM 2875]
MVSLYTECCGIVINLFGILPNKKMHLLSKVHFPGFYIKFIASASQTNAANSRPDMLALGQKNYGFFIVGTSYPVSSCISFAIEVICPTICMTSGVVLSRAPIFLQIS